MSMEQRLAKRKLDALKRGIHRVPQDQALPFSVNIVGIGKAGADVIAQVLRSLPESGPTCSAIVIDIGDADLAPLREVVAALPPGRAAVDIVSLAIPSRAELEATLDVYPEYLQLEYPLYQGASLHSANWLPPTFDHGADETETPRAYAKALYGRAYYEGDRTLRAILRGFGARITSGDAQPVVGIVFGLGGRTGSGIAVDIARHLSVVALGRAALTVGIGILPCDGDKPEHRGGALYACLNELDCLGDETKSAGVVQACGELYRNPFTAGFLVVPQQPVWRATRDLAATHARIDREIATLLTARGGTNLMEVLRLLNWVAAPSTQHSAARTPWGARWVHMLGFADFDGPLVITPDMSARLGLRQTYHPEYIETRVGELTERADDAVDRLHAAFAPDVPPQIVEGGAPGTIQFVLPCISKLDLDVFYVSRDAYDLEDQDRRVLDHSMLLEHGVVLSEPSTRLEGMAGASLYGGEGWVAVGALRGAARPERRTAAARTNCVQFRSKTMPLDWSKVVERYGNGFKVPTITGGKHLQVSHANRRGDLHRCRRSGRRGSARDDLEKGVRLIDDGTISTDPGLFVEDYMIYVSKNRATSVAHIFRDLGFLDLTETFSVRC